MEKHTPGPWEVRLPNYGTVTEHNGDKYTIEANGRFIAAVKSQSTETRYNAYLIAASPDLLAALEDVVYALEHGISRETLIECAEKESGILYGARAAIKKAKG